MAKLRIFLADDHAVVREGLKALIASQPDMEVVGETSNGLAAVELVPKLLPDVAVLDVSMPGLNGVEAARHLRAQSPQVRLLALTIHEDRSYLRQILELGVRGYVLKRAAATELLGAIRAIASGGTYIDPGIAAMLLGSISSGPSSEAESGEPLSEREEEVLRLIACGYSNKETAERLGLSTKTIETYKARALEKLGLKNRVEVVRHALQQGWLHDEKP